MAVSTPLPNALRKLDNWASGRSERASGRILRTLVATLVNALAVAAFVVVITFFLIRYVMGDPAYQYALHQNDGTPPSAAAVQAARIHLGINSPILSQFWHYVAGLVHGNLGNSFQPGAQPVSTLVLSGFSTTLVLSGITVLISTVLGTLLGLWLAVMHSRFLDNLVRIVAMGGIAAPAALVGLVLMWLNSAMRGALPTGGWGYSYPANFRYLALPVITLSAGFIPVILRVVRERARAVLAEEHIDAARTRGTPPLRLVFGHVLPECLAPLLHFVALNAAWLLSGAVVVEVVFGVPGIGRVLLNAVNVDDYPTIQACAMLTGFVVVLCFAVAQIIGAMIDPRTAK
jgi:peptide/nickel transport system permease protein